MTQRLLHLHWLSISLFLRMYHAVWNGLKAMSVFSQEAVFSHVAVFTVSLCQKNVHLLNERLKKTMAQFKNGDEKKVSEQ